MREHNEDVTFIVFVNLDKGNDAMCCYLFFATHIRCSRFLFMTAIQRFIYGNYYFTKVCHKDVTRINFYIFT